VAARRKQARRKPTLAERLERVSKPAEHVVEIDGVGEVLMRRPTYSDRMTARANFDSFGEADNNVFAFLGFCLVVRDPETGEPAWPATLEGYERFQALPADVVDALSNAVDEFIGEVKKNSPRRSMSRTS